MEDICRLCCSTKFVNNNIFDDENALYIKMSLYLPIKVFKNDRLPQKICDKCSCKVNDFYQFCNEAIEVQNRLRAVFLSSTIIHDGSIDLTIVKTNAHSPPPSELLKYDQSTQTEANQHVITNLTDTSPIELPVKVKEEPIAPSPTPSSQSVKFDDSMVVNNDDNNSEVDTDSSDDVTLIDLKKRKLCPIFTPTNGITFKKNICEWDMFIKSLTEKESGTLIMAEDSGKSGRDIESQANGMEQTLNLQIKEEPLSKEFNGKDAELKKSVRNVEVKGKRLKRKVILNVDVKEEKISEILKKEAEELVYNCCICFAQFQSRSDISHHYRQHGNEAQETEVRQTPPPPPPPPANQDPLRCTRCHKILKACEWTVHWRSHWERDRRPYRCALCEKSYRDHHQILRHGMTHKYGEDGANIEPGKPNKRFICDLCPESFVYMRYLLAHRSRAHPEAQTRALALRCATCGRQFAHLNSLRRHLRSHSGERNFLCNVCGKALSSQEHLKFHIRIHTGYKPNVCKTCGKGFVKKCNLTLHERVHSGEKPHVCSHCGKAFSQRSTLIIHERYHSGARPYVCQLCGRGFVAKGVLSMHLKTTCI